MVWDPMTTYSFRLHVAGQSERSQAAERNLRSLCDNHLAGRYELEVIDVVERPALAEEQPILAADGRPACPAPAASVLGDLSDRHRAAAALDIPERGDALRGRVTMTDSDTMQRIPTGVSGFDQVALGGLPAGRSTPVTGTTGSAKTLFAVEFLASGITGFGQPGVFVTFEEAPADIRRNAASLGIAIDPRRGIAVLPAAYLVPREHASREAHILADNGVLYERRESPSGYEASEGPMG